MDFVIKRCCFYLLLAFVVMAIFGCAVDSPGNYKEKELKKLLSNHLGEIFRVVIPFHSINKITFSNSTIDIYIP